MLSPLWSFAPLDRAFIFLAGVLALVGCSSESEEGKRFFRPPIPLRSSEDTFRQPAPASTEDKNPFEDLSKTEHPETGRILFHGNISSLPFPVKAVRNLEVGQNKQDIGGGYQLKTEIVQISEWGAPPEEFVADGKEKHYEQTYTRHLFLDPNGEELKPDQAVLRFPRVGGDGLFPVRRSGSWYQHSFKRQVALWFRISGDEESKPESVRIKALGAVDHRTGFRIPGANLYGMGKGEFRIISNSPFWHDGGMDFVFDRLHSEDPTKSDHDLEEGKIYESGGFHVKVIFFRPGSWKTVSLNDSEKDLTQESSFVRAIEKVDDKGSTLMAVTNGGTTGSDWMFEVIGVDGTTRWPVQRSGPFIHQVFGTTPRKRDRVEPEKLRIIRGPDRDRIIVSVDSIPAVDPANVQPGDLFDQKVPFFYAKNFTEAMKAVSELVALEWEFPPSRVPRKPEEFPLSIHDATVREIIGQVSTLLEPKGFGIRLDQKEWKWKYPELASPPDGVDSRPN